MSFGQFLVVFLAVAIAERAYERRYYRRADRGERKMEWSYAVFHTLHVVIWAGTAAEYFWRRPPVRGWMTATGLVLFAVSVAVRLTAIRTLGRFWSVHLEIRPEHRLITEGIYRHLRHPAYLAIMLEVISIPLVGNAGYTLVLAVGAYVPLLLVRWRREEREMIGKFGEAYLQYRRRVPAFCPGAGALARLWPGRADR